MVSLWEHIKEAFTGLERLIGGSAVSHNFAKSIACQKYWLLMTGPQKHQVKQYFLFYKITAWLSGIQESPFFSEKKAYFRFP